MSVTEPVVFDFIKSVQAGYKPSPIEVRLTQKNLEVACMVVCDDEQTDFVEVDSVSMRGAQREISGWLIGLGYRPLDRWDVEDPLCGNAETVRHFRLGKAEAA